MRTWSTSTGRSCSKGMRADFAKVDRLSSKVIDIVADAQRDARHDAGRQRFHRGRSTRTTSWMKTSGLISPDKWGNLPGGEVFTTPGDVNGTFVIDGVVGDYLCDRFGSLDATPLTLRDQGQPPGRGAQRQQRARDDFWRLHAHRREHRPRRRVRHRHEHRAASTSSATSCRTRSSPASTSPSATPTARTRAPTGTPRRTSTSSATRSTSGWMGSRSCVTGAF